VTGGLALASGGGLLAWKQQDLLTAWKVHQVAQAGTQEKQKLLASLAQTPDISTGWLLYSLAQASTAEEAEILSEGLVQVSEPLTGEGLDPHIAKAASLFKSMEPMAQSETLKWLAQSLFKDQSETMSERRASAARRLLDLSSLSEENPVQAAALQLAGAILKQNPNPELIGAIRQLVSLGAKSESSQVQVQAITTALNPKLDCLADVTVCLKSPHKEVRQAAVLALGPASETITDEVFLPCLHDEDKTIVHLTETALQARGLREDQIRLGRMMADPKPVKRLEVLDHLSATRDIDPMVWLKKMSNDPSPAVRAAAVRAIKAEKYEEDGTRWNREKKDPNQSIQKITAFYETTKMAK
jgi:hypothetical protein